MSKQLRAGILGTGFMARVHAQAVRASGHSVGAIAGTSRSSAAGLADLFPGAEPVHGVAGLIAAGVDVVHVCTPNATHVELATRALHGGASVICEKPLATSVEDAAELADLAARSSAQTGVPFVYRYHPMVRDIRRRIRVNPDNRLWLLHGSYLQDWLADRTASNWRVDPARGGASRAFGDIGVHWCDLMEFVTGQRIVGVSARLGRAFERDGGTAQNATEDGGVISFETDRGALGSLVVSQVSAGRRNRLWFSFDGPLESYSFDQEHPETAWVGRADENAIVHRDPARVTDGIARPFAVPAGHAQGYQQCFDDFVSDMYAAVGGDDRDGRPTFADGLRAAEITRAVVDSSLSREWVEVPAPVGAHRV